jgi:hypothetical protein
VGHSAALDDKSVVIIILPSRCCMADRDQECTTCIPEPEPEQPRSCHSCALCCITLRPSTAILITVHLKPHPPAELIEPLCSHRLMPCRLPDHVSVACLQYHMHVPLSLVRYVTMLVLRVHACLHSPASRVPKQMPFEMMIPFTCSCVPVFHPQSA